MFPRRIGKSIIALTYACALSLLQRVIITVNNKRTYEYVKHFIEKCPYAVQSNLELRIDPEDGNRLYSRFIRVSIEFRKLVTESG